MWRKIEVTCTFLIITALISLILHEAFKTEETSIEYQRDLIDAEINYLQKDPWQEPPFIPRWNWQEKRERLLKSSRTRKVFLYAYMRGGSSLLYEIFNHDYRAMAWYEPLAPLYGHLFAVPQYRNYRDVVFEDGKGLPFRIVTDEEIEGINHFLDAIFNCQLDTMPVEVLSNTFLMRTEVANDFIACFSKGRGKPKWESDCQAGSGIAKYCGGIVLHNDSRPTSYPTTVSYAQQNNCHQYLQKVRSNSANISLATDSEKLQTFHNYTNCINNLHVKSEFCMRETQFLQGCQMRPIRTAKILRIKMSYLEPIIQAHPDMYIVYYIRDPRAITVSRLSQKGTPSFPPRIWLNSVLSLCAEMHKDILALQRLKSKYPGLVLTMRYEDLIQNPLESLKTLYGHFSEQPSVDLQEWLLGTMHSTEDDGTYWVKRKNATENQNQWRNSYSNDTLDKIANDPICHNVLSNFGYVLK